MKSQSFFTLCFSIFRLVINCNSLTLYSEKRCAFFRSRSSIPRERLYTPKKMFCKSSSSSMLMRDASSAYWFKAGDKVQVISSVFKSGNDLAGREGIVIETWEKCDVDPTCCCAEFVDENSAVHVKFKGSINTVDDEDETNKILEFQHYFAEVELEKVK